MEVIHKFENYPIRIVLVSNLVSLAIYGFGFFIISRLGWSYAFLYILYMLYFEYRLISRHCVNCYYWGKTCGFGKGRLSALIFKKGESSKFCMKAMTWKDLIPDMLITLIPLIIGIVLLILKFSFVLLAALLLLVLLTTFGNGFIRGNLTCKYCKQYELGCPAASLFNKE